MAYSTTDEVNRLLGPHAVTATTPVTTTDVDALRTAVSYRIDAVLRGAHVSTLPVVETNFKNYLATIEAWGVAAQVLKALFPEASGAGEQPAHAYWQKLFDNAMKDLPQLAPSSLLETETLASSYFTENPDEEAELGDLTGASLFKTDPEDTHPW